MAEKLDMTSKNWLNENTQFIAERFPNCVTETEDGFKVDFELLQQELSGDVVSGSKERYRLEWPGKRQAMVNANLPTTKTLRPVREDSVDFDNTENLYIEGDNLEVLKILQESYLGKIKMIYIDPPYNTGKDFVYKDNFTQDQEEYKAESGQTDEYNRRLVPNPDTSGRYHSDWLSMMYPRIKLARNLLAGDGVMFMSIGEGEIGNLLKLSEEVFGAKNCLGTFVWQSKKGGGSDSKTIVLEHEYVIALAKNIDSVQLGTIQIAAEPLDQADSKGRFRQGRELNKWGANSRRQDRPTMWFPIRGPKGQDVYPIRNDGSEGCWRYGVERMKQFVNDGDVLFSQREDGSFIVYEKIRDDKPRTKPYRSWLKEVSATSEGTIGLRELYEGRKVFDFPKPQSLLSTLIGIGAPEGGIVLDFFSGSASTAEAVINSQAAGCSELSFIMIQLPEKFTEGNDASSLGLCSLCDLGKDRIKRVGIKLRDKCIEQIDCGFKVYRVEESNMEDVYYCPQNLVQVNMEIFASNIKADRTSEDLLTQVLLDWGLPLTLKTEKATIAGKEVFKVAGDSLYACFDDELDEAFAKAVAQEKPLRLVVKDSAFVNDTAKVNVQQLLKQLSPNTELKVL